MSVYLIYGNDSFLIDQEINKILWKIQKNKKYEIIKNNFDEINFNNLWTDSLFFEKRIFIINNFEDILHKKNNEFENIYFKLLKLVNNLNEIIFINKNEEIIKNKRFSVFLKQINIYKTQKITNNLIESYILKIIKKENGTITNDAIEYLINFLPNSIEIISNELNKILNINKNINLNLLKENISNYIESDTIKIVNSIFLNDLKTFKKNFFLIKNSNIDKNWIINLLISNIRIMRKIIILKKNNFLEKEIIKKLKINFYRFDFLKKICLTYDIEKLNKLFIIIYDYSIIEKSVNIDCDVYFEIMLLKLFVNNNSKVRW